MIFLSTIELRKIVNLSIPLYILGVLSLVFVLVAGDVVLGAKRWINLGIFALQPSEFIIVIVILLTAF